MKAPSKYLNSELSKFIDGQEENSSPSVFFTVKHSKNFILGFVMSDNDTKRLHCQWSVEPESLQGCSLKQTGSSGIGMASKRQKLHFYERNKITNYLMNVGSVFLDKVCRCNRTFANQTKKLA